MDNQNNKSKTKAYLEKLTSEETSLKRIPFYLFLLGVLVCVLIFKIGETNKYLKMIAENRNVIVETHTNDENYDSVLNIYTEEPKKQEDILPNPKEDKTENKTEANTKPPESQSPQQTEPDEKVTASNNQGKVYVINTSSKKIHLPDCSFVARTKEQNKKTVTLSDDELNEYLNNGHELCKTCGGK